jgi:phage host-nuclease inhibitor protein Gam
MDNTTNQDFWSKLAQLGAELARFQQAVDNFCQAKQEFLNNL